MNENKDSKIRVKKNKRDKKFDTLSITRELEKSLSIDKEVEKERNRKKNERRRKLYKNTAIAFLIFIIVILIAFIYNINQTYKISGDIRQYMQSNNQVKVENDKKDNLIFTPAYLSKKDGIVIVPSEKVEPKSYAYIANKLAREGYKVVVVKLNMNYPAFSKSSIENIIETNLDVKNWYCIGHSQSGDLVMSESAKYENIQGVIFLGTYPKGDDLKLINKPTLFISGTKDGLINYDNYKNTKSGESKNTYFYQIEGANNTNFANIELINNDNKALITEKKQKTKTIEKIINFIDNNSSYIND
ncbi:alpha/beta hydrolase [Peptostreptococcus equinus]|uniref:Alpha/beta hydrolase n=1 Tax=Peptostreptococcus equinus TaxID=3003601 RepID=A0ABY7JLQ9_9FIRM|nr:alpha/beta hydrolase [Peptostreptococcus sp. CBA3647]WAW14015.1 alpha/beta hydrolase [Peptostreptococcus sp. CBA3647]